MNRLFNNIPLRLAVIAGIVGFAVNPLAAIPILGVLLFRIIRDSNAPRDRGRLV